MDAKKIIWSIILILVIVGAGYLFYVQMKPFLSRPAPTTVGPEMPPVPGGPAPAPEAPAPAPAAPAAPAPAEAPK